MISAKQCEKWLREGKLDEVEQVILEMPKDERSPEHQCALAGVWLERACLKLPVKKEYIFRAYDILHAVTDSLEEDCLWNYRCGTCFYYFKNFSLAMIYFDKAICLIDEDNEYRDEIIELARECIYVMTLPERLTSFKDRALEGWEMILEADEEYLAGLDDSDFTFEDEEYEDLVQAFLDELDNGLFRVFGYSNYKMVTYGFQCDIESKTIVLTAVENRGMLYLMHCFVRIISPYLNSWTVIPGIPRASDEELEDFMSKFDEYEKGSIKAVAGYKNGEKQLTIMWPDLRNSAKQRDDMRLLVRLVHKILGEDICTNTFNTFDIIDEETIFEKEINNFDVVLFADDILELKRLHEMGDFLENPSDGLSYEIGNPNDTNENRPQINPDGTTDDVRNYHRENGHGINSMPGIIDEYNSGYFAQRIMDTMVKSGAVPMFILVNLEDIGGIENEEAFMDDLLYYYEEQGAESYFELMGFFIGENQLYIDVVAFDFDEFNKITMNYLAEKNSFKLDNIRIKTFYGRTQTLILEPQSKEYESERAQELDKYVCTHRLIGGASYEDVDFKGDLEEVIFTRLNRIQGVKILDFDTVSEGESWHVTAKYEGLVQDFLIVKKAFKKHTVDTYKTVGLSSDELLKLKKCKQTFLVLTKYKEKPLITHKLQLKILDSLFTNMIGAFCDTTGTFYTKNRFEYEVRGSGASLPKSLYEIEVRSLHATDLNWISTKGLNNYGLPELELLDIKDDDLFEVSNLIDRVAFFMLQQTSSSSQEDTYQVIYDADDPICAATSLLDKKTYYIGEYHNEPIEAVLVPWEEALEMCPEFVTGEAESRAKFGTNASVIFLRKLEGEDKGKLLKYDDIEILFDYQYGFSDNPQYKEFLASLSKETSMYIKDAIAYCKMSPEGAIVLADFKVGTGEERIFVKDFDGNNITGYYESQLEGVEADYLEEEIDAVKISFDVNDLVYWFVDFASRFYSPLNCYELTGFEKLN